MTEEPRPITTFLTKEELSELTGRMRSRVQARMLDQMDIKYILRPDGSVAVLREHVREKLSNFKIPKVQKTEEPNWDAING